MKEIVFGTSNPAKIAQVQGVLLELGIQVKSITEFGELLDVPENGETALENARTKALTYARLINRTVFSMDNSLYFDNVDEGDQPGIHVRRIKGSSDNASDEKALDYYIKLIDKYGGKLTGHWKFGFAIARPNGIIADRVIVTPTRYFTSTRCKNLIPGYPLESIQIDPETGKYIAEMTQEEQDVFWQRNIGSQIEELFRILP